jgi:SAM-dependent methyltransferase
MKDIFSPDFWRGRLESSRAKKDEYRDVYDVLPEVWDGIDEAHTRILAEHVKPGTSVLDAGCGYGRLFRLMPGAWRESGVYLGVDLSPDMIAKALGDFGLEHAYCDLYCHDLRQKLPDEVIRDVVEGGRFDLAVCGAFRGMVVREAGQEDWDRIERNIRRVTKRILYLEYDVNHPGVLE